MNVKKEKEKKGLRIVPFHPTQQLLEFNLRYVLSTEFKINKKLILNDKFLITYFIAS